MYGLIFPFPSSRKCLHVSIYIFLKQNANPAASPPSLPVFQASRLWDQPCQWKMPLSQLSLISWDQLVTAANKWLRGQGSCGESLCQAECTTGHSPGNSGARLPSYWPLMQSFVDNGLLWKYLRQVKRDATFKREKKNIQQQWPDTDECSSQPSRTDRGQQLTSVCSRKQNKRCIWAVQQ